MKIYNSRLVKVNNIVSVELDRRQPGMCNIISVNSLRDCLCVKSELLTQPPLSVKNVRL